MRNQKVMIREKLSVTRVSSVSLSFLSALFRDTIVVPEVSVAVDFNPAELLFDTLVICREGAPVICTINN